VPVAIARPFNYFGPRHVYDVIPKFVRMVLRGEPPTVHGDGQQSRDYTYVSDMVAAFLLMGSHRAAAGQVVNFASGCTVSVNEIAERVLSACGSHLAPLHTPARTSEVACLLGDASKALDLFGWVPVVGLEEGIRKTVAWHREQMANAAAQGKSE
jgi:UDP-glucose 4-epimerase